MRASSSAEEPRAGGSMIAVHANRTVVRVDLTSGAHVGSVVVGSPALPLVALTAQDADKSLFKLAAGAWIDDGVQAAIEVTEPEDYLEKCLWRTQVGIEGTYKYKCIQ